jgi:hypothetical protein
MPCALCHQKALESIRTDWKSLEPIRKHWKAFVPIGSHWNPSETIGSHLTNYAFHLWQASKRKKPLNQHFHTEAAAF